MALRAMYKGIKKVLAPIIINRPGVLAIDQDALNKELDKIFFTRSEESMMGAVNVLNHEATSTTLNTCVITVDADDRTIDFNGTPTGGNASLQLITADQLNALLAKYGDLFLSGCPSGGAENKYSLFTRYGEDKFDRDIGNGVWLRASRTYDRPLYAQVIQGTAADHLVFKPMLSKSENAPYAPFAMTNKELTEEKRNKTLKIVSGVSIDNLLGNERYFCNGNMTGLPTGNFGYLDVYEHPMGDNNFTYLQVFYPAGTAGKIYTRRYWDGAWSSWYEFTGTVVS